MNQNIIILITAIVILLLISTNITKEQFWAPSLPTNLVGANAKPHGRELNKHDFEASLERKVDSEGNPINSWYETKDVSHVQDPILHKENWDYLQGGDYYEYWYNKPWMTYKDYNKIVQANQCDKFPKIYCNNGWYSDNTCSGMPGYDGTYLYGEPESVGNKITNENIEEETEGQDYSRADFNLIQGVETTGYPG